jgi:acetyl-CoA decarbonylase/synthase complex subunit epsilon
MKENSPAKAKTKENVSGASQPVTKPEKPVEKQEVKVIDTTRQAVPFNTGNIPGPKMARAVMPAVQGKMLAKAKRPLLIVGSEIDDPDVLERVVSLGKAGIQIASVGDSYIYLADKGLDAHYINMHALASYLCDPQWPGLDGKGGYDLVVFFGITYYYASQAISALKNFSNIKVISIDKYYHPNADLSFGNLKKDVFIPALDEVIAQLPKK